MHAQNAHPKDEVDPFVEVRGDVLTLQRLPQDTNKSDDLKSYINVNAPPPPRCSICRSVGLSANRNYIEVAQMHPPFDEASGGLMGGVAS